MKNLDNLTAFDKWDKNTYQIFIEKLFLLRDFDYLNFNQKIVSSKYKMIGIRTPIIRNIAKKIIKKDPLEFLEFIRRDYYEEILLEGFVVSSIEDYNLFLKYFYRFISFIDNWAVCDMCISSMKIISKNKDLFEKEIERLLIDPREYVVRVGIVIIMDFYLEKERLEKIFNWINSVKREEYYINMAIAWLISVIFVKYKKETMLYLKDNKLNDFTHNKAIQKIRDSRRVSKEDKALLLKYKRKNRS